MRFMIAAVLMMILAMPAWAQQQGNQTAAGRVFGTATCRQKVPCPSDVKNPISSSALVANANACVTQSFGLSASSGFFDDMAGLGSDGCLTLKPEIAANGGSPPHCCEITLSDNSCAFQCRLIVQ